MVFGARFGFHILYFLASILERIELVYTLALPKVLLYMFLCSAVSKSTVCIRQTHLDPLSRPLMRYPNDALNAMHVAPRT